ncbi:DUF262 domain-containing protein [Methylobacter luteus]|uniref:DUF262 domain-containing protein n=1 Tax=Methylobacter luteus TaxID=415 RepID=UPI000405E6B1|nr:DUF262 domain-containing protein [Methylobacter luteus]
MAIIETKIVSVKAVLEASLVIPDYQRPYKWRTQHVTQLLDDLLYHRHKSRYRLGTVVLHRDGEDSDQKLSIVDGQQRILTLTLLCYILDDNRLCQSKLLEQEFSSPTTIANLQHNAAVIESRSKQLSEFDREELVDFLLNRCELIIVKLDKLSEAFQFFDAQNARGKPLEPYDLLKAFHLREMADNTEQERIQCVSTWEREVSPYPASKVPNLRILMSDYLFRLRRWTVGHSGLYFTRHNIDVFKGVSPHSTSYRYTEALRALDYMVDQYNTDNIRHWDQQKMNYPFQIDQTMINGKRFFEYISHYATLYKLLFIDEKTELEPLRYTIKNYEGCNRTGDHYVRILFECALLYYYDKFGDLELEKVSQLCFVWSYRIRLAQRRVDLESIDNAAVENHGFLMTISRALHPHEVLSFMTSPLKQTDIKGTKIQGLVDKFKTLGYLE